MALLLPVSRMIPKIKGHDMLVSLDAALNFMGMLYSALYISLVKMVVAYFECVPNPDPSTTPATLAKYRQVQCGSSEHAGGTPAMIVGMVFYVIGFFSLCVWLNVVAPKRFQSGAFRSRCKFLVNRWRADVWYWSSVYMLRNLVIALAAVISASAVDQLVMVNSSMVVFLVFTALFMPWKDENLARFDIITSSIVIFATSMGIGYMHLGVIRQGAVTQAARAAVDVRLGVFRTLLLLSLIIAFSSFGLLLVYCIWWSIHRVRLGKQEENSHNLLVEKTQLIVRHSKFQEQLRRYIETGTYNDIKSLNLFLVNIQDELELSGSSELGAMSNELEESFKNRRSSRGSVRLRTTQ